VGKGSIVVGTKENLKETRNHQDVNTDNDKNNNKGETANRRS
jgi:hypothetical protein